MQAVKTRRRFVVTGWGLSACIGAALAACTLRSPETPEDHAPAIHRGSERHLDLEYSLWIDPVPSATKLLRVWLPLPRRTPGVQEIHGESFTAPFGYQIATDDLGNRYIYFAMENPPRVVHASYQARIQRREILDSRRDLGIDNGDTLVRRRFVMANRLVPVEGKIAEIAATLPEDRDVIAQARVYFEHVFEKMRYSEEGAGWGRGSTEWAYTQGYGDSTDFHAYFVSLCRSRGIPSRFELGFRLPPQRGAGQVDRHHSWVSVFADGQGWIPVDVFEARTRNEGRAKAIGNLSENRVAFTIGRDVILTPPQDGPPVNFVISPYAEADGKPLPRNVVSRTFEFRDL